MPELADIPGVTALWELTTGDPRIRVAQIDGPVEASHPCFAGASLFRVPTPWLAGDRLHDSTLRHGTSVASLLFGQHDSPVPGLCPRCTGLSVPSMLDEQAVLDPLNTARSIEAAIAAGAHIVLLEHCMPTRSGDVDDLVASVVKQAEDAGVLLIAAAGNDNAECRCYPAALPEVLAVGACDDTGVMFKFSNYGPEYLPHAIVAPGDALTGALPDGGTKANKGTCGSAAVVAGVAALLLSLQLDQGQQPDPLAVRRAIVDSASPGSPDSAHGRSERWLGGQLDVPGATRIIRQDRGSGVLTSSVSTARAGKVYVLGTLGYDFGTEARRDTFKQVMPAVSSGSSVVPANPYDARQMVEHLRTHPSEAHSLIWTLNLELTPLYALEPTGAYAAEVYGLLGRLLDGETRDPASPDHLERVSIPGKLTDRTVRLFSGQIVPVVEIEQTRGLYGWRTTTLLDAAVAAAEDLPGTATPDEVRRTLGEFLTRIYHELRNPGRTSQDRALNFAAVNTFQATHTISAAVAENRALDTITIEKSPFCRPSSDCWDVRLCFFDPDNDRRARKVFRYTIDVSDTVPVTLGDIRTWTEPPGAS